MSVESKRETPSKQPAIRFAPGGYKQTSHGFNFQLKMLMIVLYRTYSKYSKFKLGTEIGDAGDFDDIVLEYEDKDGQTTTVIIQCKHKANEEKKITSNDLCEDKGNFCVQMYLNSYANVKKNEHFAKKYIQYAMLCTNIDIDEKLKADKSLVEETPKDELLDVIQFKDFKKACNKQPTFYKIKNATKFEVTKKKGKKGGELIKTELTKNEIEEFEDKFLLAVNLPNEKELDEIIEKEMGKEFYIVDSRAIVERLYSYIHRWMSDSKVELISTTEGKQFFNDLKNEIRRIGIEGAVFRNPEKKLEFGDFFETTNNLENKLELTLTQALVHVKSKSPSLTIIKIVQSLKNVDNFVALNLETLLTFANRVTDTFESRLNFTIYVECTAIKENEMKEAKLALDRLIQRAGKSDGKKRIVLVSDENNEFVELLATDYPLMTFGDRSSFQDLTQSAKERILDYNINFQGCIVKLKEIVSENCTEILGGVVLNKIVEKHEIKIGNATQMTKEVRDIYVDRKLEANMNGKRKSLENDSVEKIKANVKTQSEHEIHVIEGGPGIGKSTVLINMASQEKDKNKNTFVLCLNLLDYCEEFDKTKGFGKDTLVNLLIRSQKLETEFEIEILKHQLFIDGRTILYLDGFDEISPTYENAVISLISVLIHETKIRKVWVTTRPHATNALRKEFEPTVYELIPFDEHDQETFLQKCFVQLLKVTNCSEKINIFVNELLDGIYDNAVENVEELVGIPLQLRMIAEVFSDKCKAYLKSEGNYEMEITNMNVYELFKKSISKKWDIYYKEKAKMDAQNPRAKFRIENDTNLDKKELQNMAFRFIFPSDCDTFVKSANEDLQNELLSVGITQKRNDSSVFIHRAFAEYFAAQFLAEKLRGDTNAEFMKFLNCNYFRHENRMVRYFFDHILAEGLDLHVATLRNDLDTVKELINGDGSLLLKKDAMGRIPLHLSCVYSTFSAPDNDDDDADDDYEQDDLCFPVNNVLNFLISKDTETNRPTQIVANDIFNYTPYVYAAISGYEKSARALFAWHYYDFHFSDYLNLNELQMQYNNLLFMHNGYYLHQQLIERPISYAAKNYSTEEICENDSNFKTINAHLYKLEEKTRVCVGNRGRMLKLALRSFLADVVCLELTDGKYLSDMDDELRNLQLYQDWFTEAIQARDYAFLLGITLACPRTAFKLWMRENYVEFLKASFNEIHESLQMDIVACKKDEFFSDNKLKNYLVLAILELLKSRAVETHSPINIKSYCRRIVTEDFVSFEISLNLMNYADREKMYHAAKIGIEREIITAIKQINPYKLYNAFQYFISDPPSMVYELGVNIHKNINLNIDATIAYVKRCIREMDLIGLNLLLSYAIRYYCTHKQCQEAKYVLHRAALIENAAETEDEGYYKAEKTFFFKRRVLNENVINTLDQTLDQYPLAASRGYGFSLTQHIISHIVWLNSDGVPAFMKKRLQGDFDKDFADEVIEDVKSGNVNDLLRYFTFANEEQKKAVLRANGSEIVNYVMNAKSQRFDDRGRAAKEVGNENRFMSDEYASKVVDIYEYGICLLHALERNDLLMLNFLNAFFKRATDLTIGESVTYSAIFKNALNQMNYKWIMQLFKFPNLLDKIKCSGLSDDLNACIAGIFKRDILNFNDLMFGIKQRDKYFHLIMYTEAFKTAIIENDYKNLDDIFRIKRYKPEWIKSMKEGAEPQHCINYFQFFCDNLHWQGVRALLQYIDDDEGMSVDHYLNCQDEEKFRYTLYLPELAESQWLQLIKYLRQYRLGINRGLSCSIFKYIYYCFKCIVASKELPSCINLYLHEGSDESSINYAEKVIKLQQMGMFEEFCEGFYNASLCQKQEILRENDYAILKEAFENDYFEKLLTSFGTYGGKINLYTCMMSEHEIFPLAEYVNSVSKAIETKDFDKLKRLTEFLSNDNVLDLWQKVDYKTAFRNALIAPIRNRYQWASYLLRSIHTKHAELCEFPEFVTYMRNIFRDSYINKFIVIIDELSHDQKSRVLKKVNYVNEFKTAIVSNSWIYFRQLCGIYTNESECIKDAVLNVKFRHFLEYCQNFVDEQHIELIAEEGGKRLVSLFCLDWPDVCTNTVEISKFNLNELSVSIEFLNKFPSSARGYSWSIFFYAFCVAICRIKSKPIPRCISIYFAEKNEENPVNYISEIRKVVEAGHVDESLIWFFMATDEQQKEIFADNFMKGYFASIFCNKDFELNVYLSRELETEMLSLSTFTYRISNAIKNEEFKYLARVTEFLSGETKLSIWNQTDYKQVYKNAIKNHDDDIRSILSKLFSGIGKLNEYSDTESNEALEESPADNDLN